MGLLTIIDLGAFGKGIFQGVEEKNIIMLKRGLMDATQTISTKNLTSSQLPVHAVCIIAAIITPVNSKLSLLNSTMEGQRSNSTEVIIDRHYHKM